MMMERVCRLCSNTFEQFENLEAAKRCPSCSDMRQRRDTIVVSRELVHSFEAVTIGSLPGPWDYLKPWRKSDFSSYKIEVRGAHMRYRNIPGEGRIVIRARRPHRAGSVVEVRVMRAMHINPLSGKESRRTYLALDESPRQGGDLPILSYTMIQAEESLEKDTSLWSAKIHAGHPFGRRVIAVLSISKEDRKPFLSKRT
jgi:hypothetical protein